ncbi:hypothetical protein MRB53_027142 [Persea americana]|uniref:Uncharacterized protein n=1 Tax=Persea americana TaxID=3435 RepID=A0ACC2LK07_PERAE|nr:hypothetical protein MRB53_027142 [Persea americana]
MDVIWLRNPFERLVHQGVDLQISCDYYNGRPSDIANPINTGFYFVVSNNKTISMFDKCVRNYGKLVTMHANCCQTFSAKIKDSRAILDGWIKFKGQSNATSTVQWPAHNNCIRSWKIVYNGATSSSSNQTLTTSNHTSRSL